jgi:RsiW-degrading membrane proteinase PrsW (M82 family)/cell division protein ZapA (FtsZ GTPase activity inhibitor)
MSTSLPVGYSVLIASVIPLAFLLVVKWLNFFETHRFRLILLALVWGAFAVELSYQVSHPMRLVLGAQFTATHTAPIVEEVFKSLILLYLVRRADTTFFVDGAVYGFAAGIGFAIAENMLYLSRLDADTSVVVATSRAFLASMGHGSLTAIVGMALAGFPLGPINHPILRWIVGLVVASAIHLFFNNTAFHQFAHVHTGLLVLAGINFSLFFFVCLLVVWGLRRERLKFRKSLGMKAGGSSSEARLVRHADDLDELLDPVAERFGEAKREQVANALLLAAQLAMKQDQIRKTRDPEIRTELAPQITQLKQEVKQARHDVGIYIMSYVRSIMPKATWSMWARLGQSLAKRPPTGGSLWEMLQGRLVGHNAPAEGIYATVCAQLDARAAALAADNSD